MKMISRLMLVCITCIFSACSGTKQITKPSDSEKDSIQRPIPYPVDEPDAFKKAIENGTRTPEGKPGPNYWTNYSNYDIEAELFPEDSLLTGRAVISYTNNSPDTLRAVFFELAQNLHREGVPRNEFVEITGGMNINRVSAYGRELNEVRRYQQGYIIQGTNMLVLLPKALLPGNSTEFEIEWDFKIPQAGAGARMGYSQGNLFHIAYWYPHVTTYDDVFGWYTDSFKANAEFYHGFGDYTLDITVPAQWTVMSTGELMNAEEILQAPVFERYQQAGQSDEVVAIVTEDDFNKVTRENESGTNTWRFKAERVRDVAFSATLESKWDGSRTPVGDLDGDGNTDYSRIHAFWRKDAGLWKDAATFTAHSIAALSDYTGLPYPWPHMTSVEGGGIIGGGMEFPMITLIGDYSGRQSENLYDVIAHEIAHMWMPMIVSSNERKRAWMDEGSTTFHEAQARWDYYPESKSRAREFIPYLSLAGSDFEGPVMRWSDYHYPGPAYGTASYPKPATLLFALQGVIGEETFKKAWQTYVQRWAYKHPTPFDMFNTFEDVTGQDLDWFWRSWYYETWILDQAVTDVSFMNGSVTVTVEDLGKVPMPVLLKLVLEDGSEMTKTLPVDEWLKGKRTISTVIETKQPVAEVTIDPDIMFPDANRGNNTWKRE